MLVLTRKQGEGIIVGEDIRISVIEINGKQVRIGIEAPHGITVHREEIYARISEENQMAASPDAKKVNEFIKKGDYSVTSRKDPIS